MRSYTIRRILLAIPTLFLVTIIVFFIIRSIPGDIIDAMVGEMQAGGGTVVMVDRAALEHELGLDVSIPHQYGRWLGVVPQADGSFSGLFQGDLGNSLRRGTPVTE